MKHPSPVCSESAQHTRVSSRLAMRSQLSWAKENLRISA